MKPANSNLASSWGLPSPIIKSDQKKSGCAWARGTPQNLGIPFNISAISEASDFEFRIQLGFAKTHHKIIPRGKVGACGLGLGELPKIVG